MSGKIEHGTPRINETQGVDFDPKRRQSAIQESNLEPLGIGVDEKSNQYEDVVNLSEEGKRAYENEETE